MLVILQQEKILPTHSICQNCLWANQNGNPRWEKGKLDCGKCLTPSPSPQPPLYECQMGFHLVNID